MVLQAVVEAVSAQPFERAMAATVFGPTGMRDSSLTWPAAEAARTQAGRAGVLSPRPARFETPVAAVWLAGSMRRRSPLTPAGTSPPPAPAARPAA
jgi:CubicO group peptidase (beta-lactamase class C family)